MNRKIMQNSVLVGACALALNQSAWAGIVWDSDTSTAGAQDGAGTWTSASTNFYDDVALGNVAYSDISPAVVNIGTGTSSATAYAISLGANNITAAGLVVSDGGTYTINTTGAGTFSLGASGITMNAGARTFTVSRPLTLTANQTWTQNSANTLVVSGISGSGIGLTKAGTGYLLFTAANSYSSLTIKGGTVGTQGISSALGSGTITLGDSSGNSNATLAVAGKSGGAVTYGNAIVAQAGTTGTLTIVNTAVGSEQAQNDIMSGSITLNNNLTVSNNRSNRSFTLSGQITGNGTLTLSCPQTTSPIIISSGSSGTSFTGNTEISANTKVTFSLNSLGNAVSGQGDGAITFTGNGSILQWVGGNTQDVSAKGISANSGVTGTLDFQANNVTFATADGLTGAGAIVKAGAGVLTLAAANNHSGGTTVSAGTLLVNGGVSGVSSGTGSGAVQVNAGSTISGNGAIAGASTIFGTLSPGNSPGVLSFDTTLTLKNGSISQFEIQDTGTVRGTDYDGVNVGATNGLTYDGTLTIAVQTLTSSNVYDLFAFAGTASGAFDSVAITGGYSLSLTNSLGVWSGTSDDTTFTFNQSTGDLTVAAVPEPASLALLAAGTLIGLPRQRVWMIPNGVRRI